MEFKFLKDFPAIFIKKLNALVIADLHIGLEFELLFKGIRIPNQAKSFLEKLMKIYDRIGYQRLIILGDLKHKLIRTTRIEEKIIKNFVKELSKKFEVIICKGNHDAKISLMLPEEVKLASSKGIILENFGFFHGHAWPSKKLLDASYIFMGHIHPAVYLTDVFGERSIKPVFIVAEVKKKELEKIYNRKAKIKKLIILPAFNKFSGNLLIDISFSSEKFSSPLWRINLIDCRKTEIYLLDGRFLGNLEKIKS